MKAGESSIVCYQNTTALGIVIKFEPPLQLPPSFLPSFMLYLFFCLFSCIVISLFDPFSIIKIISLLLSLSMEDSLCSRIYFFFLNSLSLSWIFSIPCWFITIWCLGPSVVFAGVFIALLETLLLCH